MSGTLSNSGKHGGGQSAKKKPPELDVDAANDSAATEQAGSVTDFASRPIREDYTGYVGSPFSSTSHQSRRDCIWDTVAWPRWRSHSKSSHRLRKGSQGTSSSSSLSVQGSRPSGVSVVARCCAEDAIVDTVRNWPRVCGDSEHVGSTSQKVGEQTIVTTSLLLLTTFVVLGSIMWLKTVLVPVVLAILGTFLLEPLLLFFLNPFKPLGRLSSRVARFAARVERKRMIHLSSNTPELLKGEHWAGKLFWKVWAVASVIFCILAMMLAVGVCVVLVGESVASFRWEKYSESPRTARLLRLMQKVGELSAKANAVASDASDRPAEGMNQELANVEYREADLQPFISWLVRGPLVVVVQWTASAMSTFFLMVLFLAFLLLTVVGSDPETRLLGLGWKAQASVRRYIMIKTQMSTIVAILVLLVLLYMEVDLAGCFAMLTFLLNYIPHVGYTVSVFAPLPLMLLDPEKTLSEIVWCAAITMLIHQIFSNGIEPRLLHQSLVLHPVVVIVALAFWVLCWGIVGGVLSTPITCIFRLIFMEIDHPLAVAMVALLEGEPSRILQGLRHPRTPAAHTCDDARPERCNESCDCPSSGIRSESQHASVMNASWAI